MKDIILNNFSFNLRNKTYKAIANVIALGMFFCFLTITIFTYKSSNTAIATVINSLLVFYEVIFLQFILTIIAVFVFKEKYGSCRGIVFGSIYGLLASILQFGIYFFTIGIFITHILIDIYNKYKTKNPNKESYLQIDYLICTLLIVLVLSLLSVCNQFISYKIGDFIYNNQSSGLLYIITVSFSYVFGMLGSLALIVDTIAFQTQLNILLIKIISILFYLSIFFAFITKLVINKIESKEEKQNLILASVSSVLLFPAGYILLAIKKPLCFFVTAFLACFIALVIFHFVPFSFSLNLTNKPLSVLHFAFNNSITQVLVVFAISLFSGVLTTLIMNGAKKVLIKRKTA